MEDLWAFNDERVARAIFDSEIPVISAEVLVGSSKEVSVVTLAALSVLEISSTVMAEHPAKRKAVAIIIGNVFFVITN